MADIVRTSPLSHRPASGPAEGLSIAISEISDRGMIDLRGEQSDTKFMNAARTVLGVGLPTEPRTSAREGDITVLWLSVDQWLITMPAETCADILAALQKKTAKLFALVCDVSDARAIIRLEGNNVREVLMKGTPVDLTRPGYDAGVVRRMQFAEIAAMCHVVGATPDVIDLYVFRSYADYAWEWLEATAPEAARVTLFAAQQPAPV